MIKKLTKHLIIIGCIAVISITLAYCMCAVADRIEQKERIAKCQRVKT